MIESGRTRGMLKYDEPMARHVTWGAGGVARRAYFPADARDLASFLGSLRADEPLLMVGLGSNLLVREGGYQGTVVFTHPALGELAREPDGTVRAGAGVACPKLARFAANQDLAGAEFLAGIPGTVGGALAMNAGCFGGETWSAVDRVRVIDRAGRFHEREPGEYVIGYRRCGSRVAADEWFVCAWFRFADGEARIARARIRELLELRVAKQPLQLPNAGSVFRNPPGDHAARLIEAAGLKGLRVGGARVSEKHANFIVNPGRQARAGEIEALIERVHETVLARFGVDLVREVRIVGEPPSGGAAVNSRRDGKRSRGARGPLVEAGGSEPND
jgi:UDP-N-acetylmuramate dehydrogenase